jgi:hemoglobin-like flavoprotein
VDSINDIEVIVMLSVLTHWPYLIGQKKRICSDEDEDQDTKEEKQVHKQTQPALLIAEEYHWDTLVSGEPLLKIKTTGIKAAALCLQGGRHLVQLNVTAPICFHLEMWSQNDFVFQEQDEVLHELTKESLRYRTHAMTVLTTVATVVSMFDDIDGFREAFYGQGLGHRGRDISAYHCTILYSSLVDTLDACLGDLLTHDLAFAWKAFMQEGLRVFLQGLEKGIPKSASEVDQLQFRDLNFIGKKRKKRPVPDNWIDREPTDEEQRAAVKIQACFRGYWQYKLWMTVKQDSPQHAKACGLLEDCLEIVTAHAELVAMTLFQNMFRKDPRLLQKFPFKHDEWSRCCFEDHTGNYKEQPANCTFLMFRETFFVQDHGLLVVPHLYASVPVYSLRVMDNDTGEEVPKVFQRVSPHVYLKNKRGYTFVAEGRSGDKPIPEGKCHLRLIGSESELLRPRHKGKVNCEFYTRELKEYYLPNRDYEFVRYEVKVSQDMVVTVRLTTSKESAYIKLQILDVIDGDEQELISARGKGHAVIPAFVLLTDGVRSESSTSCFSWSQECPLDEDEDEDDKADKVTRTEAVDMQSRAQSGDSRMDIQSGIWNTESADIRSRAQSGTQLGAWLEENRDCVKSAQLRLRPAHLSPLPITHKLSLPTLSVSDCGDIEKTNEAMETSDKGSETTETTSDCGTKESNPSPQQFTVYAGYTINP